MGVGIEYSLNAFSLYFFISNNYSMLNFHKKLQAKELKKKCKQPFALPKYFQIFTKQTFAKQDTLISLLLPLSKNTKLMF
jgi:hypothetical protein